jgi:asparagine synthase (glutamine-hydrolysing)
MCGFLGIAATRPVRDPTWFSAGRDVMGHRGPDDSGEWWSNDSRVGLGHRRLSILDLSPLGHQPMRDEARGITIVFNGEIYNHRELREELSAQGFVFCSHSDTEVLLAAYAAWGQDCLARVNGMFAFALYDTQRRTMLLARDRAGEKPLFYRLERGVIYFASELKALMTNTALPRRIDMEALDCYLAMGFVPGQRCILQDYNKLPPAHVLTFDLRNGATRVRRYWSVPKLSNERVGAIDETALLDELEVLLEDAVGRQLVADVPVGILLSGGVDSSLVTAMAVRATSNVKTFTVRFPGYANFDETEHARLIARHFCTDHVELEAAEARVDLLPLLARQFDEPMADSSMIPTYLVSQLIRDHCTVALGGDGGDELFAGYQHYNRLLWAQRNLDWIWGRLRVLMAKAAETMLPIGFKGRNWVQGLETDLENGLPLIAACFDRSTRSRLMAGQGAWDLSAEQIREQRIPQLPDLLQRATRMDFENYLPEDILVKVDRASMLNSLEVRSPLLDYRVIEFAFGRVPSCLKATATSRKVLLKKLAARLLPSSFNQHRKQGFSIPLASWLQTPPWKNFFQDVLLGTNNPLFDRKVVTSLLAGQAKGRANSERLFALVMFELWRHEYRVSI